MTSTEIPPKEVDLWQSHGVLRVAVFALSAALVVTSGLVLFRNGRWPASVPADAPEYSLGDLLEALRCVDSRGFVDLKELTAHRAALDRFVASMAKTSPLSTPEQFPNVNERVAFWLNASHALLLQQLADQPAAKTTDELSSWRSWPIGGQRMTRDAITTRFLAETGDGRVWLAWWDGSASGPLLDGAPFGADTLDRQLDEAARRFLQRPDAVTLAPPVVKLTPRITTHLEDFLAALPEGRTSVLQIVWAYLPETCDGLRPGCDTRAELDRVCGGDFSKCRVEPLPTSLAMPIVSH